MYIKIWAMDGGVMEWIIWCFVCFLLLVCVHMCVNANALIIKQQNIIVNNLKSV